MNTGDSPTLNKIIGFSLIFALIGGSALSADPAAGTDQLSETIHYLLAFVKESECRFFRNDKEHSAGEAAAHMQRKYEHFKNEIKTAEEFIRLAATKSLMTGRLYYVKLKNGEKMTSEAWLLQALDTYRQKQE